MIPNTKFNPYHELNLPPTASVADIKKAFRRISMRSHPDKGGDEEKYKNVIKAYNILTDKDSGSSVSDEGFSPHIFLGESGPRFSDAFKKVFDEAYDNFVPYKMNMTFPPLVLNPLREQTDSLPGKLDSKLAARSSSPSMFRRWIQTFEPYVIPDQIKGLETEICNVRATELIEQCAFLRALPYLVKTMNVRSIANLVKQIHLTMDLFEKKIEIIGQIIKFLSDNTPKDVDQCVFLSPMCDELCATLVIRSNMNSCRIILDCSDEFKISDQILLMTKMILEVLVLEALQKAMYSESMEPFIANLDICTKYRVNSIEKFVSMNPEPESGVPSRLPKHYLFKILFANAYRYRDQNKNSDMIRCLRRALMQYPVEETFDHVIKFYSDYQRSFSHVIDDTDPDSYDDSKMGEFKYQLDHVNSFRFLKAYESACQKLPMGMDRIWCYIDFAGACQSINSMKTCLIRAVFEIIRYIDSSGSNADADTSNQGIRLSTHTINGLFCVAKELLSLVGIYEAKYSMMSSSISCGFNIIRAYKKLSDSVRCLFVDPSANLTSSLDREQSVVQINAYENIHEAILHQSIGSINKFRSITPLHGYTNLNAHDDMYESIMLNNLTVNILKYCQNNISPIMNHIEASYYLMEGSWNGWNDDDFDETRLASMIQMLCSKAWNIEMVEELMKPSFLPRDEQGFIKTGDLTFNEKFKSFSKIHGFVYNQNQGTLELITSSDTTKLFTDCDVVDIFKGIDSSLFTLDQPDGEHAHHPFQHMKYYPQSLKGTDALATLLMTDYILKCVTTGKECSASIPFSTRDTSEGFMAHIPEPIKKDLTPVHMNKHGIAQNLENTAHRFWIEAGEIGIEEEVKDDEITILFKDPKMYVKKNVLEKNDDGIYIDEIVNPNALATLDDLEKLKQRDNSPEAAFARNFTKHYDEISLHLPVFARLRELCKLQAVLKILKGLKGSYEKKITESSIDTETDQVISVFTQIRSGFQYPVITQANENKFYNEKMTELRTKAIIPIYTESNVNKYVQEQLATLRSKSVYPVYSEQRVSTEMNSVLAQNGVTRSQVAQAELQRVESSIRSQLQTADTEILNQVNTSIRKQLQDEDTKIGPQVLQSVKNALIEQDRDLRTQLQNLSQSIFKKQSVSEYVNHQQIVDNLLMNREIRSLIRPCIKAKNIRLRQKFILMMTSNNMLIDETEESKENAKLKDHGECSWVPAVFCNSGMRSKIYGGVNLSCSFAQQQKVNDEVMRAVQSRAGFGAVQTGRYTFEKTDVFTGDKTKYQVNTTGSGWREHVSTVYESVERTFKPMVHNVMSHTLNTLNRLGFGGSDGSGSNGSGSSNYSDSGIVNLRVIRRDLENVPFRTGHLAHSAVLIRQGDQHHLLEVMSDGKAHLHKNIPTDQTRSFATWADYQIQGKDWRGQVKGLNIPGDVAPEHLQEMMQEVFNEGGGYNPNIASSSYNVCHSAQERLIQKLKDLYGN